MRRLLAAAILATVTAAHAQEWAVRVAWDASETPDVTYRLYVAEGGATRSQDAGAELTATVSNLQVGVAYSFHVVAVDAIGIESLPSNVLPVRHDRPKSPGLLRRIAAWLMGGAV
jgi:hypothetical protein